MTRHLWIDGALTLTADRGHKKGITTLKRNDGVWVCVGPYYPLPGVFMVLLWLFECVRLFYPARSSRRFIDLQGIRGDITVFEWCGLADYLPTISASYREKGSSNRFSKGPNYIFLQQEDIDRRPVGDALGVVERKTFYAIYFSEPMMRTELSEAFAYLFSPHRCESVCACVCRCASARTGYRIIDWTCSTGFKSPLPIVNSIVLKFSGGQQPEIPAHLQIVK